MIIKRKVGRPYKESLEIQKRRAFYCFKFGLASNQMTGRHRMTEELVFQLDRCADDEARRLILGVSR